MSLEEENESLKKQLEHALAMLKVESETRALLEKSVQAKENQDEIENEFTSKENNSIIFLS